MSLLSCPLSGPVAPDRIEAVELTPQEPVCDTVEVRRVVGTCQDLLKVKGPIGSRAQSSIGIIAARHLGLRCSQPPCSGRPGLTTADPRNHCNHPGMTLCSSVFQSSGKLPAASRRGARGSPTATDLSLLRPCPARQWADPRRQGAPPAPHSAKTTDREPKRQPPGNLTSFTTGFGHWVPPPKGQ